MKKTNIVVLLISIIVHVVAAEEPKNQVVCILPIEVQETTQNSKTLELLSTTIQDNLSITLRFMKGYDVTKIENTHSTDHEDLAALAENESAENVIFGSISRTDKAIEVELSVYDRYQDKVFSPKKATTASLFETFDIADLLVRELLEDFSGIRIAYGSLNFQVSGPDDEYKVIIDDKIAGYNVEKIEKLIIGEHRIRVIQERPFDEVEITSKSLEIEEGREYSIEINLPYLTQVEKKRFTSLDKSIVHKARLSNESDFSPLSEFKHLRSSRDISFAQFESLEMMVQKYERWEKAYAQFSTRPDKPLVSPNMSFNGGIKKEHYNNLNHWATLYDLYSLPHTAIKLDGAFDEWSYKNNNFSSIKLARNDENYFVYVPKKYLSEAASKKTIQFKTDNKEMLIHFPPEAKNYKTLKADIELKQGDAALQQVGEAKLVKSDEGYEMKIPKSPISEYLSDQKVEVRVVSKTAEKHETHTPTHAFFTTPRYRPFKEDTQHKKFAFPVLCGTFSTNLKTTSPDTFSTDIKGSLGVLYSWGWPFYFGIEASVIPTNDSMPFMLKPSFLISRDPTKGGHLFDLLYVPNGIILLGYGYSYKRFTVKAGFAMAPAGRERDFWIGAGYLF